MSARFSIVLPGIVLQKTPNYSGGLISQQLTDIELNGSGKTTEKGKIWAQNWTRGTTAYDKGQNALEWWLRVFVLENATLFYSIGSFNSQ